jgi:hypothetical protein
MPVRLFKNFNNTQLVGNSDRFPQDTFPIPADSLTVSVSGHQG